MWQTLEGSSCIQAKSHHIILQKVVRGDKMLKYKTLWVLVLTGGEELHFAPNAGRGLQFLLSAFIPAKQNV